jgi:predicted sugar kinase
MNNYRERLIKALIKFYEGGIEAHKINIEVLLGSHVGLAEHGDIIETLDAEVEKLSALEDKLEAINKHFLK